MEQLNRHKTGFCLFLIFLCIGFYIIPDYGISVDELEQRKLGIGTYNYIFHDNRDLFDFRNKTYGVAFQLPLVFLEKLLRLEDSRAVFLVRHFATHLFFLVAVFYFYLLLKILFENEWIAVFGSLLLVLHPRLYGHSFFNPKDIPFMSMMIISFYYGALSFKANQLKFTALYGIAVGLLVNIRIMGVILVFGTLIIYFMDAITSSDGSRKRTGQQSAVFLFSVIMIAYITWPYLWEHPVRNFMAAFSEMSQYPWKGSLLFMGQKMKGTDIPWHYSFVWISITTPLMYLLIIVLGLFSLFWDACRKPLSFFFQSWQSRQFFLYGLSSLGSLAAVIVLHSVLYNGWRQLYFVYPGLVLMGMYGIQKLFNRFQGYQKYIGAVLICLSVLPTVHSMIQIHPLQYVFFNGLVSKADQSLGNNFEMEYWGPSYKMALEKIVLEDHRPVITVAAANWAGLFNWYILTKENRKRLKYVKSSDYADYLIIGGYHRLQTLQEEYTPLAKEWYSLDLYNSRILSIYKLR